MKLRWKQFFFFLVLSLLVACSDNEGNSPPEVLRTVPAAGNNQIPTTTTLSVTFNESVQPEFPDDVLNLDPAVTGEVTYNADQRTLYFSPNSELSFDTTYTVTMAAGIADLEGLATDKPYTWTFSTVSAPDVTKPEVQGTTPADGASGIALNSAITATLTESVDTQSVSEGIIELSGGSSIVTGTISVSDSNIVFQPTSPLAAETTYTATLSGDVADLAGNTLGSHYIWAFTTGPEPDTTSPTVSSKTPADGATDIPLDTAIRVTFSEDVDASVVNAVTFSVASAEDSVTGSLQVNGSEVIFTPEADLAPLTAYMVNLTTGIQDLSGNPLSAETYWTFTTAAALGPEWGSPLRISAEGIPTESFSNFASDRAKFALDDNGDGFAIWQQENEIWGSRYLAADGWSAPFAITASGVDAGYPDLSVNGRGDAVVIWTEYSSTEDAIHLFSRFFKPATGWAEILPLPSSGFLPRVVLDEQGNATAGWERSKPYPDGTKGGRVKTVGINHYTPDIGWGAEILLEDLDYGSSLDDYPDWHDSVATPTLIVGSDGRTVHAIWVKTDNDYYLRHAYGTSSGWSTPTDVHVTPEYIHPFTKGVTDSAGNLLLAILENTPYDPVAPGSRLLQTIRGGIGAGWESPFLITKAPDLANPGLAMDDSGNAMIVWREENNTNREDILSRIYSPGDGWLATELVETLDLFTAQYYTTERPAQPSVAALGHGEFVAAWHQRGEVSGSVLYTNCYTLNQGWESPTTFLDGDSALYSMWPLLDSAHNGKAVMVWGQSTAETWAMEYK